MNKLEEVIKRLKLDIKSPLACGDVTVVIVDDLKEILNYIDNSISKEVIEEKINNYKQQLRNTTKRVVELQVLEQNRMLQKNEIEELNELLRDIDKIRAKIEVLEELLEGK